MHNTTLEHVASAFKDDLAVLNLNNSSQAVHVKFKKFNVLQLFNAYVIKNY